MQTLLLFFLLFVAGVCHAQETLKIVVADGNFYPYEYVENGQFKGTHFDTLRAAAKRLNIKITFNARPWKRAIAEVKEGSADAITYIAPTEERRKYLHFLTGNILSSSETWLITLSDKTNNIAFNSDLTKMQSYVFGVGAGFAYGEPFDSLVKELKTYEVDVSTLDRMAQMLISGRIDIMLGSKRNLLKVFSEEEIEQTFHIFPKPIATAHNYIAFSKASPKLHFAEKLAQEITAYKASDACLAMQKSYNNQNKGIQLDDCM